MTGQLELVQHVNLQRTKAAAKGNVLFGVMRWSRNTTHGDRDARDGCA